MRKLRLQQGQASIENAKNTINTRGNKRAPCLASRAVGFEGVILNWTIIEASRKRNYYWKKSIEGLDYKGEINVAHPRVVYIIDLSLYLIPAALWATPTVGLEQYFT